MKEYVCKERNSFSVETWIKNFLESHNAKFNYAMLHYEKSKNINFDIPKENAPLRIYGTENNEKIIIYIYCATAGYDGTGPKIVQEILNLLGFNATYKELVNNFLEITNLQWTNQM